MNTFKLSNGLPVNLISDTKFKTCAISLNFSTKLCDENVTYNSLIPSVLKRGCKKYPDTLSLNRQLDKLYGAHFIYDISKIADNQIVTFIFSTVSDNFSGSDKPFKSLIDLIYEIIYNPLVNDNAFNESFVSREKENLALLIDGIKNDKKEYAKKRLIEEMFEGSPYSTFEYGITEKLNEINHENLYTYYKNTFLKSILNITVTGSYNENEVMKQLENVFSGVDVNSFKDESEFAIAKDTVKVVIEDSDVSQSKLVIGYNTSIRRNDELYFAMLLFNNLFGASPHSKLFLNVREKLSLAYYASSGYNSFKGFLLVSSGINASNYEKALNEIDNQLNEMKAGNFTEDDIMYSKLALINTYRSTKDNLGSLLNYYSTQPFINDKLNLDETIKKINMVTKEDIIKASNTIIKDTVYLLKGCE